MTRPPRKIGIVGARGHVGAELLRLLSSHGGFELALVSSRSLDGQRVCDVFEHPSELRIRATEPGEDVGGLDALVLALPNGLSEPWVAATGPDTAIVDVSADHRFDPAWTYGLPEHFRDRIRGARRIANPGCYATGMQVALRPILDLVDGDAWAFGVSGYSGAGTTPSPRNDPAALADNLMPYAPTRHMHEREVTHHLDRRVHFMPHVAPFFRGIALTVSALVTPGTSREAVAERYAALTSDEPLVRWSADAPLVRDAAHRHEVNLGGLAVDSDRNRLVIVATLDNLLKGAATQVMQNLNLACGFDELEGIA